MRPLTGINWGHRRDVGPFIGTLPGFRRLHPEIQIEWSQRSLADFEFDPVPALARNFDLIILDHPFCGDIAKTGCLLPLDDLPGLDDEAFVGPSLASYRYAGHVWALPVDAACQVAASRPDLMERLGAAVPATWDDALALGRAAARQGFSLAMAFNGVHALMTFFTLCANLGRPCGADPAKPLLHRDTALDALEAMRALLDLCPGETLDWDSIGLHEAMTTSDRLVFCPAVYLYATYAEADHRKPLRFHDLPGPRGHGGSTIGGTGLGISSRCRDPEAALAYAAYLLRPDTQAEFTRHRGQPARVQAWMEAAADRRFGGAFAATRATMEASWIRPRHAGYRRFQKNAGELVEGFLRGAFSKRILLRGLEDLHARRDGDMGG